MKRAVEFLKRARGDAAVRSVGRQAQDDNARLLRALGDVSVHLAQLNERIGRLEQAQGKGTPTPAPPPIQLAAPRLTEDVDSWKQAAQPGELAFHKRPNDRSSERWDELNQKLWERYEFGPGDFRGKTIIDIGAGSRLRTLYFDDAEIIAVEPLAQEFIDEVEWNDLDRAKAVYPVPAEVEIPELVGAGDFVVSINALDHGFNFEDAIVNARKYVRDDGCAFLSFDQHYQPDSMHPLVLTDGIVREVFERAGWRVTKFTEQFRYHGGAGPQALNYWLEPA